ncbi:TPA: DUF3265 domain-containing protein [Vibrio vulnificus]|nr:DUF3265 domain-containing protein [Vibrio vulnificus]HDY7498418.1 DUF3265 domain-containing protein [Vibrio vulnificus]
MNHTHNKALKRDSCRMAFLVCSDFCGESGLRKVGLSGIHPLTQRYVYLKFKGLKFLGSSSLSLWQFVPSKLSKSALSF